MTYFFVFKPFYFEKRFFLEFVLFARNLLAGCVITKIDFIFTSIIIFQVGFLRYTQQWRKKVVFVLNKADLYQTAQEV